MEKNQSKPATNTPQPKETTGTPGLAIAALILGIISFLTGWLVFGGLFGVIAIILGIVGMRKPGGKGLGIVGIILGSIGIIGSVIGLAFWVTAFNSARKEANTIRDRAQSRVQEHEQKTAGKRNFSKGETAKFGDLAVTVNDVTRRFTPENRFYRAKEGKELIVVTLSVKNNGKESASIYRSSFGVEDSGLIVANSFVPTPGRELPAGQLASGATISGQVVYEVTANASDLKLTKEETVYNPSTRQTEKITYTLAF